MPGRCETSKFSEICLKPKEQFTKGNKHGKIKNKIFSFFKKTIFNVNVH